MDNIVIINGFLYVDCRNYADDLLLLNDLKRTLADNMNGDLKGIFVDLRQQYNICSSIIGNIARFYKEHKAVVLLVDMNSHIDKMLSILNFELLAKIFYYEREYTDYIKEITNSAIK